MIPNMVGKFAPNSSHFTRGLVKSVPGRSYFRAVPSQNGDKYFTHRPPQSLNLSELPKFRHLDTAYFFVVIVAWLTAGKGSMGLDWR